MTYKDQFVVEVKADGQILRVRDGSVYLPFGCEYSILLKNLNSKKASVKVSIDGTDVLDGYSLILDPLVTHELKGFFNGMTVRNRFRFIQKTKEIQEHRGDRVDDGLIRVEFAFEKSRPEPQIKKIIEEHHYYCHNYWWPKKYDVYKGSGWEYCSNDDGITGNFNSSVSQQSSNVSKTVSETLGIQASFTAQNAPNMDEGITVKGNEISEQYNYGCVGELEESSVIVISLKGLQQGPGVIVKEPITVKTKLTCPSCGKKSKSSFKFCPNCGTYLE
jgi:hypothetical protein